MNPLIQLKTTPPLLIALALLGFALSPKAQAVVPAPDGGYPGGNTAEGQNALLSLNVNTGTNNTAVGWFSLKSNVEGQFNTGVGAGTLFSNTAHRNTAIGGAALFSNTVGSFNTAVGMLSLFTNSTGSSNTAIGDGALLNNSIGSFNTAIGRVALLSNTDGSGNVATGAQVLASNTTGDQNTANGYQAMLDNTTGGYNTAIGFGALGNNITGNYNTANGYRALRDNNNGDENTAIGAGALLGNTTGGFNTAVGLNALLDNTTGSGNTAIGALALVSSTGLHNIALGANAGNMITTASNAIVIGTSGANVSDSCFIGNIWQQPGGSQAVFVNSEGKLGGQVSSRRLKDEIIPMDHASEVIYGLKPVSFRYKPEIEPTRPLGFGLIAEDVEEISPALVTRDSGGKVNSVRYEAVNAMLLNEFLKEHRKNEEQEATISRQQKQIEALTAGLQKVSAQLEGSKPGPQLVNNP